MRPWPTMRLVILPQAARVVVPPLGNEFITMLKQTSLLSIIGVTELFRMSSNINSVDFKTFEIFFVARGKQTCHVSNRQTGAGQRAEELRVQFVVTFLA